MTEDKFVSICNNIKELENTQIKIPISALDIITDRLNSIEDSIDIKNQVAKINFLVKYRKLINVGDQKYIEHVFSWIGSDFNIENKIK